VSGISTFVIFVNFSFFFVVVDRVNHYS